LVIGGVELPDFLAGFGVYCEDFSVGGGGVEDAVYDEAVRLEFAFVAGVERPGLFEVFDVLFVDLGEGGVVRGGFVAEVVGPVGLGYQEGREGKEGDSHPPILCDCNEPVWRGIELVTSFESPLPRAENAVLTYSESFVS
jgi:hypothetical protein